MQEKLGREQSDHDRIDSLVQEVAELRRERLQVRGAAILEVKRALTEEQRAALAGLAATEP